MAKLSRAQLDALQTIREHASHDGWCRWRLVRTPTASVLLRKGLIEQRGVVGDPWWSARYRLTDAGSDALEENASDD